MAAAKKSTTRRTPAKRTPVSDKADAKKAADRRKADYRAKVNAPPAMFGDAYGNEYGYPTTRESYIRQSRFQLPSMNSTPRSIRAAVASRKARSKKR